VDRERFDAWTRLFSTTGSRRGALTALLGAAVLPPLAVPGRAGAAKKKGKGKGKGKGKRKGGSAEMLVCHGGETLRVPRDAVAGILLDGGTRGACAGDGESRPPTAPPGGGAPRCNNEDECPGAFGVCCNGQCINGQSDRINCGQCGNTCNASTTCVNGQCVPCVVCNGGACRFDLVQAAIDTLAAGSIITICPGTYQEHIRITKNVTLVGQGLSPRDAVLDGQRTSSSAAVLTVDAGQRATVRNLSITGGNASTDESGGGVTNEGELVMDHANVLRNVASIGGGIANRGQAAILTLVNGCQVRNNSAERGGGLSNDGGQVTLRDESILELNTANERGGGAYNRGGTLTLDNGIVADNTAPVGGGIENESGTVRLIVAGRIAFNTARAGGPGSGVGGGVHNLAGAALSLSGEGSIFQNTAEGSPGSGGGVLNLGTVSVIERGSISSNDPDNCINRDGGTGCPA
jgi:hypothetical protein